MNAYRKSASPFYPPRAGWWSSLYYAWQNVRFGFRLDRVRMPHDLSVAQFVAGAVIPGLSFHYLRRPVVGRWLLAGYLAGWLVFLGFLGYDVSGWAMGLLVAAHGTSLIPMAEPLLREEKLATRLVTGVLLTLLLGMLVYFPFAGWFQDHVFVGCQMHGRVYVVNRMSSPAQVKRGDWIAYGIPAVQGNGLYLRAGMGIDPVLGLAGDRIQFTPVAVRINGVVHPRQADMPTQGEMIVPQNHWFLWPSLNIQRYGNPNESVIDRQLRDLSIVPKAQFSGKVCRHWFGRVQY